MRRSIPLFVVLLSFTFLPRTQAGEEGGFKPIFNGKNLDGWHGKPEFWSVREGAITGQTTAEKPTKGNTFLVWQGGDLDDFELRLKFRIEGGNSGIQYRSEHLGDFVVKGYQADLDASNGWTGVLYEERGRGVLAGQGRQVTIPAEGDREEKELLSGEALGKFKSGIAEREWNDYTIIARGNRLIHQVNGQVTADVTDHGSQARRSGVLALQLHAGPPMLVQFKDIELKRLPLEDKQKIVMVAGTKSHGYAAHEFAAGCLLLKQCLDENVPGVLTTVYQGGWPKDPTAFDNADAIVLYMNGGGGHPVNNRLDEVDALMQRGVGLACMHYAVEVPAGKPGAKFLDWIGGYFETYWSVNPHWELSQVELAKDHPITRGVEPFFVRDEWYYHMRFRENEAGVTPILSATPPDSTRRAERSERGGNPDVAARKGQSEVLAWARQRENGGRGFGFTGGHVHWNWAQDDFRKLVLNALVWVARAEVPEGGVPSSTPTLEMLEANQDYPQPGNFNRDLLRRQLAEMQAGKQ